MKHGTCLFCDRPFVAKSKARKFCHDCLPEHADDPKVYGARYLFLRAACLGRNEKHARCSIAHLFPKGPRPVMHGPPAPKACGQCGELTWNPKFCSRICSRRAHNATENAWELKQRRKRARRAMLLNVPREPYRNADIFERDRWLCQLCGLPIDPALSHPDPMSKSIDHIKPLSLGGADAPDNVQAAHLTCNLRKHDRFDGFRQLSLEVA